MTQLFFSIACSVLWCVSRVAQHAVEHWGTYELTLTGPASGNRFFDGDFTARFAQGEDL